MTGGLFLAARSRALLADQQGLGKTVQAIDAADMTGARTILVLCKAIAKIKWQREFERWASNRRPYQIPGARDTIASRGVVILNYELAHRKPILAQLLRRRWDLLICDEMQMLRGGAASMRGQVVLDPERGLAQRAAAVYGLSGTPAPNHIGDMYAWLRALHPERVPDCPTYIDFLKKYTHFTRTPFGERVWGVKDKAGLRALLAPVMLRRTRKQVFADGPELRIDELPLSVDTNAQLRALEDHPDILALGDVLEALKPGDNPEAAIRAADIDLATLRRLTGLAKVDAVAEQVRDELAGNDEKIVLMCWHREVIESLTKKLADFNAVHVYGGQSAKEQQKAIDIFAERSTVCRVFVGQLLTAGTSIDLIAASRMLLVEIDFVPGNVEQAILRILRIGQDNDCRVSFASLGGSIDETVMRVYARKANMLKELFL